MISKLFIDSGRLERYISVRIQPAPFIKYPILSSLKKPLSLLPPITVNLIENVSQKTLTIEMYFFLLTTCNVRTQPKQQTAVHMVTSRQTGTATSILRVLLASCGKDIRTIADGVILRISVDFSRIFTRLL